MRIKKRLEQYQDYIVRLFPVENATEGTVARTITFQVTEDCNLNCTYCYQINKSPKRMSFETAKKFIDMLLDADENSNEYINPSISPAIVIEFIGGEPLMEIDLISQITEYLIDQMTIKQHIWATRFRLSICSNGLLYFDERVQRYLQKYKENISFSISIDGNKELHDMCRVRPNGEGSYDIAIKGVKHWTEELGLNMGSKMTLAPENITYTFEALKSLIENGYDEIYVNCVYEEGWEAPHATILYNQLILLADYMIDNNLEESHYVAIFEEDFFRPKDEDDIANWCGGTGSMLAVDYKGAIYPCLRYMPSSLGTDIEPLIIGNVDDGMVKTQKEIDCVNCMKKVDRRTQSTDECFNCPIAQGCSWCSAYNYQALGSIDKRATYICIMHKARALANIYYWNKVYQKHNEDRVFENYVPEEWALEIIDKEELDKLNKIIAKEL